MATKHETAAMSKEVDATPSIDHVERPEEPFKWDAVVLTNIAALFCVFISATWALIVPPSAIPYIAARFPAGASLAPWIATTPSIALTVIQVFIGDLSDILGRREFLIGGTSFGIVGTLITGRATSMPMVIGGQVLNGIGLTCGYLCVPFLQEAVPKIQRPTIMAASAIPLGTVVICGPIIEGAFIRSQVGGELDGWRLGLYLATGFYAISLGLVLAFYHPGARPEALHTSFRRRLLHIDWLGIGLITAGLVLFLLGLSFGGNPYPWTAGIVLGPMVSGVALIMAFGAWETWGTSTGIIPHRLFGHRNFLIAIFIRFVGGIALFGGQAYYPQVVYALFTNDGLEAAVFQLPFSVGAIVGGVVGPVILRLTREGRWVIMGTMITLVAGAALMNLVRPGVSYAAWFFPAALTGAAVAAESTLLNVIVGICTPDDMIATAIMFCSGVGSLGGSIAIPAYSSVFTNKLKKYLPEKVAAAALANGLPTTSLEPLLLAITSGSESALLAVPGISPSILTAAQHATKEAYSDSFRYIWFFLLAFAAAAVIISAFLLTTKDQLTDEVVSAVQTKDEWKHRHENKGVPEDAEDKTCSA